jgi:hypothetical protein
LATGYTYDWLLAILTIGYWLYLRLAAGCTYDWLLAVLTIGCWLYLRLATGCTYDAYNYGEKYVLEFGSRTKVDVIVSDAISKKIVDELIKNLSTGSESDGKIFVKDISEAHDIGSKQDGDMALQ